MMKCRKKTGCFTRHRKIPPEKKDEITRRLKIMIIQLINRGYLNFGACGALGFDTMAEQAVQSVKKRISSDKAHPCSTV
ncbi:hypothetical protein [Agathobacter sp.]|uniref:hypothetical protein n=1 Tax=Agathobacter sp. TaxID=2021311 RepID=UPI003FD7EEEF